jgi:hypothetical protein
VAICSENEFIDIVIASNYVDGCDSYEVARRIPDEI